MRLSRLIAITLALGIATVANGQWRKIVRGSGDVKTEERTAAYFNSVHVSTGIDVYLTQGSTESIKVEADDNLIEHIITEVRGNTLYVKTDRVQIRNAKARIVHVSMKDIEELQASSAGDIIGKTRIETPELYLSATSAGDIRLEVYTDRLECEMSSSGDITLEGKTDILKASLSSAGDLKAYDLIAREGDVSTSSAGDAKIHVTERLRARASSAGDIYYEGQPKYLDAHSSSAGGIHRR